MRSLRLLSSVLTAGLVLLQWLSVAPAAPLDELIAAAKLGQEHHNIEGDQREGDDRGRPPLRVVVADRKHKVRFLPGGARGS